MELKTFAGLPAHPLFVHLPVVLIPLAGVIAIVFAFRPAWLDRFGWGLVSLSGVGMVGAILAASSGGGLEDMQRENGEKISQSLLDHAELGETARTISIVFFVVVLAVVLIRHFTRQSTASTNGAVKFVRSRTGVVLMAAVLAVSASAATYTMAAAGHQGARQVWHGEGGRLGGGEGGEEGE